jgi:choline dehydrogenase-like flavoprotein
MREPINILDGMVYTRGSSSDYDRFAEISGDPGWGWDRIQQYLRKVSIAF